MRKEEIKRAREKEGRKKGINYGVLTFKVPRKSFSN